MELPLPIDVFVRINDGGQGVPSLVLTSDARVTIDSCQHSLRRRRNFTSAS